MPLPTTIPPTDATSVYLALITDKDPNNEGKNSQILLNINWPPDVPNRIALCSVSDGTNIPMLYNGNTIVDGFNSDVAQAFVFRSTIRLINSMSCQSSTLLSFIVLQKYSDRR